MNTGAMNTGAMNIGAMNTGAMNTGATDTGAGIRVLCNMGVALAQTEEERVRRAEKRKAERAKLVGKKRSLEGVGKDATKRGDGLQSKVGGQG